MYGEFIGIYVCLAIIIVLLVVNLFMTYKMKIDHSQRKRKNSAEQHKHVEAADDNVFFCKSCARGYNAKLTRCPNCGAKK